MLQTRVIPCLLLNEDSLVKTVKFDNAAYIGDPINTVRIFNELEVDELIFLDITASKENRKVNFQILEEIANECFMPLAYGGGIKSVEDIKKILQIGLEKVAINSEAFTHPELITQAAAQFGSQSIIGAIDIKKNFWGKYEVYSHSGTQKQKADPVEWAKQLAKLGVGEILLTAIHKEGTWSGFDIDLIEQITKAVNVPVIVNGGAQNINSIGEAVHKGGASAVALGSMVVFQAKGMGVLVNFPDRKELEKELNK